MSLLRGSRRFESSISSYHSRRKVACECNEEEINDEMMMTPRRALRGGISKVNFGQSLSTFGNTCPQNGSKNEPRAPRTSLGYPHIGPFMGPFVPILRAGNVLAGGARFLPPG